MANVSLYWRELLDGDHHSSVLLVNCLWYLGIGLWLLNSDYRPFYNYKIMVTITGHALCAIVFICLVVGYQGCRAIAFLRERKRERKRWEDYKYPSAGQPRN